MPPLFFFLGCSYPPCFSLLRVSPGTGCSLGCCGGGMGGGARPTIRENLNTSEFNRVSRALFLPLFVGDVSLPLSPSSPRSDRRCPFPQRFLPCLTLHSHTSPTYARCPPRGLHATPEARVSVAVLQVLAFPPSAWGMGEHCCCPLPAAMTLGAADQSSCPQRLLLPPAAAQAAVAGANQTAPLPLPQTVQWRRRSRTMVWKRSRAVVVVAAAEAEVLLRLVLLLVVPLVPLVQHRL